MLIESGLDPSEEGLLTYERERKFVVMQMHQSDDDLDEQSRSYAVVIWCLLSSGLGGEKEKKFGDASLFVSRHFGTEQLSSAASLDSCTAPLGIDAHVRVA